MQSHCRPRALTKRELPSPAEINQEREILHAKWVIIMNLSTLIYTHPRSSWLSRHDNFTPIILLGPQVLSRVFFILQWSELSILHIPTWTPSIHDIGKIYPMAHQVSSCGHVILRMSQRSCNDTPLSEERHSSQHKDDLHHTHNQEMYSTSNCVVPH